MSLNAFHIAHFASPRLNQQLINVCMHFGGEGGAQGQRDYSLISIKLHSHVYTPCLPASLPSNPLLNNSWLNRQVM